MRIKKWIALTKFYISDIQHICFQINGKPFKNSDGQYHVPYKKEIKIKYITSVNSYFIYLFLLRPIVNAAMIFEISFNSEFT